MRYLKLTNIIFFSLLILILGSDNVCAVDNLYSNSGLKLPRFVSLAQSKTNVRVGPGQKYPVKWVLDRKSLPVEVVLEFDNWRKIIDHEGQEGWVFHSLLSGKRTAVIVSEISVYAYEKPHKKNRKKSRVTIELESPVLVSLEECNNAWCKVSTAGFSGWIEKKSLWGVYEHEKIQ